MNYFLKVNKTLLTYSLIILIVIPIFGFNFLISFLGNILVLLFLIPLLVLLLVLIRFNSFKSKLNTCDNCGSISIELSDMTDDRVIWSNKFDRENNDIFLIENR